MLFKILNLLGNIEVFVQSRLKTVYCNFLLKFSEFRATKNQTSQTIFDYNDMQKSNFGPKNRIIVLYCNFVDRKLLKCHPAKMITIFL